VAGPRAANPYSLRRFILPALFLGVVFAGYFRTLDEDPVFTELSGESMGTTFSVKVLGDVQVEQLVAERLTRVDDLMSTWKADSELSRFNAGSGEMAIDPLTERVFRAALGISEQSGGAFDVTVGPLVGLWGFGVEAQDQVPDEEALEAVIFGWRLLEVGEGTLSKSDPAVQADLSAIAKGFAVDYVAEGLVGQDYGDFMVELGGEVRTGGSRAGQPWRIAVERPDAEGRVVHTVVELDGAMATSGDYRQFVEDESGRRSHTIDPRTRRPVEHGLASVSVRSPSCMLADGWATALSVLGAEEGLALAEERGLPVLMLDRTEAGFEEKRSAAW